MSRGLPAHGASANSGNEKYADLLYRAAAYPETLTAEDKARLLPQDLDLISRAIEFHTDVIGAELAARLRSSRTDTPKQKPKLIADQRWQKILESVRNNTHRYTDLTIEECLALDTDEELKQQYEAAFDEMLDKLERSKGAASNVA